MSQPSPQTLVVRNSQSGLIGLGRQKKFHSTPPAVTLFPLPSPCFDYLLSLIVYCSYPSSQLWFFVSVPFSCFFHCLFFFSSFVSGVCVLYILSPCDPGLSLSSVSLSRVDLVAVAQSLSSISVPSFVALISFGFISFRTYRLSMLALGST